MIDNQINEILKKINKRPIKKYIRSPLNYTGNKYRILDQILPFFPKKIDLLVDLFSGGATVGLNANAEKVVFVDSNIRVINLLKWMATYSTVEHILEDILPLINKYSLSLSSYNGYSFYRNITNDENPNNGLKKYNSEGFYILREDYNALSDKTTKNANIMLYVLMVYAFNNDMRFSKVGHFNLPIGKTDFNLNNIVKLRDFIERNNEKKFTFICTDFDSNSVKKYLMKSDFIYMDPPYLITTAVYNEANQWTNNEEYRLLNLIDEFIANNYSFMLSNVLEKKGIRNEPLYYWITKNSKVLKIIDIDYHYKSASYNKINREAKEREIIITLK